MKNHHWGMIIGGLALAAIALARITYNKGWNAAAMASATANAKVTGAVAVSQKKLLS